MAPSDESLEMEDLNKCNEIMFSIKKKNAKCVKTEDMGQKCDCFGEAALMVDKAKEEGCTARAVSYTHLRAHET